MYFNAKTIFLVFLFFPPKALFWWHWHSGRRSYFGQKLCFICLSWFWPTLLLTGFRFKSQIKPLKTCTLNPLAMIWKQSYTSASYLRRVEFIFSLGHRWNEFVSHNLACNKFISWSQNYSIKYCLKELIIRDGDPAMDIRDWSPSSVQEEV